jgi:methionine synthase II (cobalamin-independent)
MQTLPSLAATGIGSVPFLDEGETLDRIFKDYCPQLPYWPQMIRLYAGADIILMFARSLPLVEIDLEKRTAVVTNQTREAALADFYQHVLDADLDHFALPEDSAHSFYAFLKRVEALPGPEPAWLKGQVTGPITMGQSLRSEDGRSVLHDAEYSEVLCQGLGLQAAWQAARLRGTGRAALIVLDEPGLAGYGSAFSTLSRETVVGMIEQTAEAARGHGEVLIGIHVCGNTDWQMVLSTSLDLIHFDAYSHLDAFLLFPKEIGAFLRRGGALSWGIVPTLAFTGRETPEALADRLLQAMARLADQGLPMEMIKGRSLVSPACGLGPLDIPTARRVSELVARTAARLQREP